MVQRADLSIEQIERDIRDALFAESMGEKLQRIAVRTRISALGLQSTKAERLKDAFWAGYRRGRIDHRSGAFWHATVYVWAALLAGLLIGGALASLS